MSEKRLYLVLLIGGSLVALGAGALIYNEYGKIAAGREAVATLRGEIETSRKLLTGTSELEREVIVLRETEEAIKEILPDERDVNNFVRDLRRFEEDSEVRITGLKKRPQEAADKKKGADDFDKVAYQLTFEADAFQLLGFMDRIESHSRFMRITNFKVASAPRRQVEEVGVPAHKVQMDVETYVYEPQGGPTPVKVEGYVRKRELLLGEITRRRQALAVASYSYRGRRGRRDPWVDPRVPVESITSKLTVPEQSDIVDALVVRTREVVALWEKVKAAANVIEEMTLRAEMEQKLTTLEEETRALQAEGSISFVTAKRRLELEVSDALAVLREKVKETDGGRGPTLEELRGVMTAMNTDLGEGNYDGALNSWATIEPRLAPAAADPARAPLVEALRGKAEEAKILSDFTKKVLDIKGVAIGEGVQPVALINGRVVEEGEQVDDELVVRGIRAGEIEFIFRGVVLVRRF